MDGDVYEDHQQVNELDDCDNPVIVCKRCGLVSDSEESGPCVEGKYREQHMVSPGDTPCDVDAGVTDDELDTEKARALRWQYLTQAVDEVDRLRTELRSERDGRAADARAIVALADFYDMESGMDDLLIEHAAAIEAAKERVKK